MVRHVFLMTVLAVSLPLGDPEPTPSPSPEAQPSPEAKPTPEALPKLSAPSPTPTEKLPSAVAEVTAEAAAAAPQAAALTDHRIPPYEILPLAPSYGGPELPYAATRRDFDPRAPGYSAPASGGPTAVIPGLGGHGGPLDIYGETERSYGRPAKGYGSPSPGYGKPAPSYGAPAKGYGAPAHGGYAAPAEDHCYAKTHFKTTWRPMTQYKTHWATQQLLVPFTMYKYVTATSYWPTTHTEWKEVVKTLPYRYVAKTQVVYRTKTLLEKHQDYTNTEYVWHTQNYMDHHTVTKHITRYVTKTNYYTDTVTEYVQKPVYYTETATVYEAKYHTKKVTEPYYETIYKTVKKPEEIYETYYQTKQEYHTVYRTHAQKTYHTVTHCPPSYESPYH